MGRKGWRNNIAMQRGNGKFKVLRTMYFVRSFTNKYIKTSIKYDHDIPFFGIKV